MNIKKVIANIAMVPVIMVLFPFLAFLEGRRGLTLRRYRKESCPFCQDYYRIIPFDERNVDDDDIATLNVIALQCMNCSFKINERGDFFYENFQIKGKSVLKDKFLIKKVKNRKDGVRLLKKLHLL